MIIPRMLNTTRVISPDDHFVCPGTNAYTNIFGKLRPNFVPVSFKKLQINVQISSRVALKKNRRRLVGDRFINKPEGHIRSVLNVRQYNITGGFDESAFRVVRGSKAPCTPFPAIKTTQTVSIAEGDFNVEELSYKRYNYQK